MCALALFHGLIGDYRPSVLNGEEFGKTSRCPSYAFNREVFEQAKRRPAQSTRPRWSTIPPANLMYLRPVCERCGRSQSRVGLAWHPLRRRHVV